MVPEEGIELLMFLILLSYGLLPNRVAGKATLQLIEGVSS
jgi:hypothetical protein